MMREGMGVGQGAAAVLLPWCQDHKPPLIQANLNGILCLAINNLLSLATSFSELTL